jgi:hypothetical protein
MSTSAPAVAKALVVGEPHPLLRGCSPATPDGLGKRRSILMVSPPRAGYRFGGARTRRESEWDPTSGPWPHLGFYSRRSVEMPYFACPRCGVSYYSAASWAYAPACPSCQERLDRPGQSSDRVVSISAGRRGKSATPGAARDEPSSPGAHQ